MKTKPIFRGIIFSFITLLFFVSVVFPLHHYSNGSDFFVFSSQSQGENAVAVHKLYGLFDIDKKAEKAYIGGFPVAMALQTDGVIVEDILPVETPFGRTVPCQNLKKGDLIFAIDDTKISSNSDIESLLENTPANNMKAAVLRKGNKITVDICPVKEEFSNKMRFGLLIRDYLLGVGMVTYVKEDGSFGALGHAITDSLAGNVPIRGGEIYDCQQLGISKGKRGTPGELRVKIDASDKPIGQVSLCDHTGVYGTIERSYTNTLYPFAERNNIKMGDAYVYVTLDDVAAFYKIEIIKAVGQSGGDKGLVIRVVDDALVSITGGIIQGMSGSPIVQNDRIIGAVTHVFVNDPTKGYGLFIEYMQGKNQNLQGMDEMPTASQQSKTTHKSRSNLNYSKKQSVLQQDLNNLCIS
jgi:stage IV sporulation protein B